MTVDRKRLVTEGPTVVGMLTTSLESGGSLDTAVRSIAREGPPLTSGIFEEVVRLADTRGCSGVREGLSEAVGRLPSSVSGYKHALLLCITASESEGTERLRLLGEASDIALDSVKAMGESYSNSLTVPCMTIFGLGIMLPMVLMSLLPMLGIGGVFGTAAIDGRLVSLVTLVMIPAIILALALGIRRRNPFLDGSSKGMGALTAAPLLLAAPLAMLQLWMGSAPDVALLLSVGPAAAVTAILAYHDHREDVRRRGCNQGLRDSVFEMGNRMLSGGSFETVCLESLGGRPECSHVHEGLRRELALCRGDIGSAIEAAIGGTSREVSRAFRDISACSEEDNDNAGRLAIALGRQFHNSDSIRRSLDLRLKSMTDMMVGTAVLFAPMVLGMSVSMLEPLSDIPGYVPMEGSGMILSVYLVELCGLISVLTCNLGSGHGASTALWRFCLMTPVALTVFTVCSSLGVRR